MAPKGAAYHTDWVWSDLSDVHVANHRDWFINFTEFTSQLDTIYFGPGSGPRVLGVGDVELDVKKHHKRNGAKSHRKIILKDVLYAPHATCNVIGSPILQDFQMKEDWGAMQHTLLDKVTGVNVGILDNPTLTRLRLVGYRQDQTSLNKKDGPYMINARWPDAERARWEKEKQKKPWHLPSPTADEIAWLKKHYGNEYKFLRAHGLSIYKDDQRAEGRAILRAMMNYESDTSDDDDESGVRVSMAH